MTVCDAIVNHLLKWRVDVVFGLPSDGINGLMEALRKTRSNLRYVQMRHEEAVAMAATEYAKFTEKLGVCFTTSSPCAIHTHLVRWADSVRNWA